MPKGLYFATVFTFFLYFDAESLRLLNGSHPHLDIYSLMTDI